MEWNEIKEKYPKAWEKYIIWNNSNPFSFPMAGDTIFFDMQGIELTKYDIFSYDKAFNDIENKLSRELALRTGAPGIFGVKL